MTVTTHPAQAVIASAAQELPFARGVHVRAFLLPRPRGNLLVYSNAVLDPQLPIARQYLNHWHEAMFAPAQPPAPVFVHEADRARTQERMAVRAAFSRRHTIDDDFEVIPTPGHTPGATAYLWDSGEHRFLFTGDSVYLGPGGAWVHGLLASSDRAALADSLELMAGLDFDVLVPWAAPAGEPWFALTGPADARRRLEALADEVR